MTFPKLCAALLLTSALAIPAAHAQDSVTTQERTTRTTQTSTVYAPVSPLLAGPYVGAQVGYRVNPNVRTDLELSYRQNDYSATDPALGLTASGDIDGIAALFNAWYDFTNASFFTPYIGGGLGFARGSMEAVEPVTGLTIDDSDTAFVYQLGAGVSYDLGNNVALTTDYRYIDTSDFSFDATLGGAAAGSIEDDYRAHEIRVGARYTF